MDASVSPIQRCQGAYSQPVGEVPPASTMVGNRSVLVDASPRLVRATMTRSLAASAVGVGVGLIAWQRSGAAALALAGVGVVAVLAAVEDVRTFRIPNRLVVIGLAAVAMGVVLLVAQQGQDGSEVAGALALACLLGGAPLMFVVWLVRPESVGGGDWKLTGVCGMAIGLIAPLAAALVLIVAAPTGYVLSRTRGQRNDVPMGPGLAAGYIVAFIVGALWPGILGGVQ